MCHKSCLHHLDKEIIMIDINNVSDYIEVPDYILDKYTRGVIIPAHFSDYLRCCLLYKHGGFWIDSTIYMTDNMPDYILDSDFFAFSRPPVSMGGNVCYIANNSFYYCKNSHSPLMLAMKLLLEEYWKYAEFSIDYCMFHALFSLAVKNNELCKKQWEKTPFYCDIDFHVLQFELFNKYSCKRMEQIKRISPLHKLSRLFEFNASVHKDTIFEYLVNNT